MATYTRILGGSPVTIYAPMIEESDYDAILLDFRRLHRETLIGLDVEGRWMGDGGQFADDFAIRLAQFGTSDTAWVLDVADPVQRAAAVELLRNPQVRFCSHSNMDVLSVAAALGVDITTRNVDTLVLACLAEPDALKGRDLKTLTERHIGPELGEAEAELHAEFARLWKEAGGRGNVARAKIQAYGWSTIPSEDERYVVYAGLDAVACRRLADILVPHTRTPKRLLDIECWLAGQANRIQIRGMKVDLDRLDAEDVKAHSATAEASASLKEVTGGVGPQSPKLAAWFGEHGVDLATWEQQGGTRTPSGAPSLAEGNVDVLATYPLDEGARVAVEWLRVFRTHLNAKTTTEGVRRGLDRFGRIHPKLSTVGTTTGRHSSSGPNMQNFASDNTAMRGLFIPEDGYVLVSVDYDQVELRGMAALARELLMIDIILSGGDLHQQTADMTGLTRKASKPLNFGAAYGGGAKALHEQTGLPLEVSAQALQRFWSGYLTLAGYRDRLKQVTDAFVNIGDRFIPVTRNKAGQTRTHANLNYMIQSSCREMLVHSWYRFATETPYGNNVWFPIHDELVLQVPEDQVDDAVAAAESCMNFDFQGVPITATATVLLDDEGVSRWMSGSQAEKFAEQRALIASQR